MRVVVESCSCESFDQFGKAVIWYAGIDVVAAWVFGQWVGGCVSNAWGVVRPGARGGFAAARRRLLA